jgi:phage shock protein PspC (stress-responsive transcriptional regulator)
MTCSRCSKDLEDGSVYCRFCGAPTAAAPPPPPQPRKLWRLPSRGQLAGVCAGLADYFDTDVTLVRLAWVLLSIVPGFFVGGLIAYAVAWILLPVGPDQQRQFSGRSLRRSESDRMIAGICGGLAEYFGVDAAIVRIAVVILTVYPGAIIGGALLYIIAWLVIPTTAQLHVQQVSS